MPLNQFAKANNWSIKDYDRNKKLLYHQFWDDRHLLKLRGTYWTLVKGRGEGTKPLKNVGLLKSGGQIKSLK